MSAYRLFSLIHLVRDFAFIHSKETFLGYWSKSVNGDLRAIYQRVGEELVIFALIGTHSELYG